MAAFVHELEYLHEEISSPCCTSIILLFLNDAVARKYGGKEDMFSMLALKNGCFGTFDIGCLIKLFII